MIKALIGVFSGVFIGSVIYELINRSNPELLKKLGEYTFNKFDDVCGVNDDNGAMKENES